MAKGFRSIAAAQASQLSAQMEKMTLPQAYSLLVAAVAEADRRRINSRTIEAIRVLLAGSSLH